MATEIPAHSVPSTIDADGVIRVGGTRVTLETVVGAFESGESAEEIAAGYPALSLADVYDTIAYYLRHRNEMRAYLAGRQAESSSIRREIESRRGYSDLRERLLERARKGSDARKGSIH